MLNIYVSNFKPMGSFLVMIMVAVLGHTLIWAHEADPGRRPEVGPLIQVSDASPFGALENCGNFPGNQGINFTHSEVEPWVAINPADPLNVAAFWQQDRWSNGGARSNVAGVSFDGGLTWRTVVVPGLTDCSGGSFERASDPWISFGPTGVLHQISLVLDTSGSPLAPFGVRRSGMAVSRSEDGGLHWSDPILLIDDQNPNFLNDKEAITADPGDADLVYAVWDRLEILDPGNPLSDFKGPAMFARTTDGGRSWQEAEVIFDPGVNNQVLGTQIVVLPDGTLLNFFNKIINVNPDGSANPFPNRLTFIRSHDRGMTWEIQGGGTEIAVKTAIGVVTPDLGAPVRSAQGLFDVAVDPDRGDLYVVWQDSRFSGFDQIAFSRSEDEGVTWSLPIRINATPANTRRPFTQQAFLPSVVVDGNGTVAVTYYDFRNDDGTGEMADHFVIFCGNACQAPQSWENETRLTEASFDYLQAPLARGFFIGDYMGLAAGRRGAVAFFQQALDTSDPASGFFRQVSR